MVHLSLAGVSGDGKRLLLVSDAGVEFTLDLDDRLRSAARGDTSRIGQLEITMESALRPRDIQARIRAGATPEAVAEAAQTSVDKIMPYAGPVLAEREHLAQRAQASSVRRKSGDGARTLGDAVAAHLGGLGVKAEQVEWDAWRREDGRWTLTAVFSSHERSGEARFTFDVPGNYVVAEDDDARWLVGEVIATATLDQARDDLEAARRRRSAAQQPEPAETQPEQPVEAFLDTEQPPAEQAADERERAEEAADAAAQEPEISHDPTPEEPVAPPARRPARKNRGRASVPSWDEIMFGSKD